MSKKTLLSLTLTELWCELKFYADNLKKNDSTKVLNELNRLIQSLKEKEKGKCEESIIKLLRVPIWLLRHKITKPSIILIALHRNSPKELVEALANTYGEKFSSSVELLSKKDYENKSKEDRVSLRLADFKNAVEKSKESAIVLLADYFINRIDFKTEIDNDKKISWAEKFQPRIEILYNHFSKNFKTEQGIVLSVKQITDNLTEDLACIKNVLQLA